MSDKSTKSALQKQKITVLEHLLHRLAVGKNAAKPLHIAQDAAEQVRARMERLRDETDGADVEPDDEFQYHKRRI